MRSTWPPRHNTRDYATPLCLPTGTRTRRLTVHSKVNTFAIVKPRCQAGPGRVVGYKLVFPHLMAGAAEMERNLIRKRTAVALCNVQSTKHAHS